MARKKGKIWELNSKDFQKVVSESNSLSEILKKIGLVVKGNGNFAILKRRILEENIDASHIKWGKGSNKGRKFSNKGTPLEEILVENSSFNRFWLKKKLFEANLLEKKCKLCGLGEEWNGKKLSLQLDHENGISDDNRLENLRILCPNCHSQTDTFGTKNRKC